MKILVKNGISIYSFDNTKTVTLNSDHIIVGDPVEFTIGDCNSSNTTVHLNVTPPVDWIGGKYLFDGTTFSANPDWVDPDAEENPE